FIPLIKNLIRVAKNKNPSELDGELKKVALITFLFADIFGIVNTL
ncbi:MAG: 1,4-dihydroxy-2-naphthoate polyprenyltransferase, partial [Polaribacter sp.]|nr:1,4-dihydroxy-2-naphthoate polyprenyltransferase [Polaribacter sp.]